MKRIKNICILGGGTAGFTVSSMLARYRELSGANFGIKVIHSKNIGSIGVGESTVINFNELVNYLNLEDRDWMAECDATYKVSLKFSDFYKKGSYFYYPFGYVNHDNINRSLQYYMSGMVQHPECFTTERVAPFFIPMTILSEKNKLVGVDNDLHFSVKEHAAYHFDAYKFADLLQQYSSEGGVEVIDDTFREVKLNDDGSVKSLVCDNGTYEADLFVDCSGFRSLLLGEVFKEPYISFRDTLINNKVLRAKIPYKNKDKELKNYTDSVALKNGWCWHIPLWDHMSVGYVHTNKFATPEEIESEFFEHVGEVDYETIEFKTGRYERGWVKNVIGVGLSYGFIEPLESTGIATMIVSTFRLLEGISKHELCYNKVDVDLFNQAVGPQSISRMRPLVEMHYYLARRDDSDYWNYITDEIDYGYDTDNVGLASKFNYHYFLRNIINRTYYEIWPEVGTILIPGGNNFNMWSNSSILQTPSSPDHTKDLEDHMKTIEEHVKPYKSSYRFLSDTIYSSQRGFG